MKIEKALSPSQVNNGVDQILFVEGNNDSIDVRVLQQIVNIKVQPLGPSYNITSVPINLR